MKLIERIRNGLVASLPLLCPVVATGATWLGGSGDYNTDANWDTNAVPGQTEDATISSGVATRGGNLDRSAVTTVNGSGQLLVNGRLLNAFDGGPGTINVSDNGVFTQNGDYFIVSTRDFDGTFNQTGGTVSASVNRGFFLTDGEGSSATRGVYNALGGVMNAELLSTSGSDLHNFQAGRRGREDAFVVDGGEVNFFTQQAGRRIYFSQDSTLQIKSGSYNADGLQFFAVGYGTSVGNGSQLSGTARMMVSGGVSTINLVEGGAFVVADGQEGLVEVSGGSLTINGQVHLGGEINGGNGDGRGDFVQTGGVVETGEIFVAPNGTGSYAIKGGDLRAADISYGGGVNSYFAFEDGAVVLDGDRRAVVNESWFAAPFGANASYNAGSDTTTITRDASVQNLQIEVNTQTGGVTLRNPNSSFAIETDYYEVRSEAGALTTAAWTSLDGQIPDGGISPTGDFNGDNRVDAADYTVWRDARGTSVTPGTGADADNDGFVDNDDYESWKDNYGAVGAGSGWTEAGGSDSNLLAEYYLEESGFSLASGASYDLGSIFETSVFGAGANGDLTFSFETPGGYLVAADVVYVGNPTAIPEPATLALFALASGLFGVRPRV